MDLAIHSSKGRHTARLARLEQLLALPAAKAPRHATDWAETDGVDYNLLEPLQLEASRPTLYVSDLTLRAGEQVTLDLLGRRLPALVLSVAPHRPHEGWTELQVELLDLAPLFGESVAKPDGQLVDIEQLGRGVRIVPDWETLYSPPRLKHALEASELHETGRRASLSSAREARRVTLEVWIRGSSAVERYLELCTALRQHTAGRIMLRGRLYYLRYQRLNLTEITPDFVSLSLECQQWRYD